MPTADLAATPATPPASRSAPAFAQFPTAWRFALRNQTRNRLAGLLLVVFVPVWYLLMAALAGHQPLSFKLFATGQVLTVDARSLTLITAGLNALTLITGFAVFAAIRRTLAFDQRLVFAGYRQPTLIAAKTSAIAIVAAGVAGYTAAVLLAFWRPGLAGLAGHPGRLHRHRPHLRRPRPAARRPGQGRPGRLLPDHHGLADGHLPAEPARQPHRQQAHPGMVPLLRPHAVRGRRGVRAHRPVGPPAPRPGLDRRLHHRRPGSSSASGPAAAGTRDRAPRSARRCPGSSCRPNRRRKLWCTAWLASSVVIRPALTSSSAARPRARAAVSSQRGRQGAVEVAGVLAAPDDLEQPVQDRAVPGGVLVRADRRQVPQERIPRRHLPPGIQQPDQRHGRRYLAEPGSVERGRHLGRGPLDDRVQQRLAGREVGVDGLPADPGGPGDVVHARVRPCPQRLGRGAQDRGDALPGVGSLPPAPGLRLCWSARGRLLNLDSTVRANLALTTLYENSMEERTGL